MAVLIPHTNDERVREKMEMQEFREEWLEASQMDELEAADDAVEM